MSLARGGVVVLAGASSRKKRSKKSKRPPGSPATDLKPATVLVRPRVKSAPRSS
jgi:hypothetical protein